MSDDVMLLGWRCQSCGHRFARAASHCPQCSAEMTDNRSHGDCPEICQCDRCKKAREADEIPASATNACISPPYWGIPRGAMSDEHDVSRLATEHDRAVACVTAMQGIPDPAAFVVAFDKALALFDRCERRDVFVAAMHSAAEARQGPGAMLEGRDDG